MSGDEIKGLIFGNMELGTQYNAMTSDITEAATTTDSPVIPIYGRLIGFGVTAATHTHGVTGQIVRISLVFD